MKISFSIYKEENESKASVNGLIFEYLVCEALAQKKFLPFYYQAKFEQVPNVDFDIVLYDPKAPIVLAMKTSLRERI